MTGYGGLGEARQFAGSGMPGALPAAQQHIQSMLNNGPGGATLDPTAAAQLGGTASGEYLGANPYLDDMYNNAASQMTTRFNEDVLPGLAGQFGAAGRTGSGAQALMTGRAAGDLAGQLRGLAGDIYAPAYESERGRQVQAAGQLGQLGLSAGQISGNLGLGAAQTAGDLFSRGSQDDISRAGLASDLYLGERGLGQQAAQSGGQLGLGMGELQLGEGSQDLNARQLAMGAYTGGLDRQMQGGQYLGQLGMGGIGEMNDLFSNIGLQQFRGGTLAPSYSGLEYGNIDRLSGVGNQMDLQAQDLINADQQRWDQYQQAPWQNLDRYSNLINQLPGGYGTQTGSGGGGGGRLAGAAGGAATGMAVAGPWGALAGGVYGLLSS